MGYINHLPMVHGFAKPFVGAPPSVVSGNEIAAGYEEQEDSEGGESTDDGDVGRP